MLDRLDTDNPLVLLAALIIGTIAVGRATRLAVHDLYPPAEALRAWWWNRTYGAGGWRRGWGIVLVAEDGDSGCPFCFAPYAAAVSLTWVLLAGLSGDGLWSAAWWVVNVWAGVSYAAAILYTRDERDED